MVKTVAFSLSGALLGDERVTNEKSTDLNICQIVGNCTPQYFDELKTGLLNIIGLFAVFFFGAFFRTSVLIDVASRG